MYKLVFILIIFFNVSHASYYHERMWVTSSVGGLLLKRGIESIEFVGSQIIVTDGGKSFYFTRANKSNYRYQLRVNGGEVVLEVDDGFEYSGYAMSAIVDEVYTFFVRY